MSFHKNNVWIIELWLPDWLWLFINVCFFYLSKHHKASKHTKYVFIVRTKWKNVLWMLTYFFSDCIASWLKEKMFNFIGILVWFGSKIGFLFIIRLDSEQWNNNKMLLFETVFFFFLLKLIDPIFFEVLIYIWIFSNKQINLPLSFVVLQISIIFDQYRIEYTLYKIEFHYWFVCSFFFRKQWWCSKSTIILFLFFLKIFFD